MKTEYLYYVLNLKELDFRDAAMDRLGTAFDVLVNHAGVSIDWAVDRFMQSGLAEQFEKQNVCIAKGMDGAEIASMMLEGTEYAQRLQGEDMLGVGFTPEFWFGEMAAYFQTTYGCRYSDLFAACNFEWFNRLRLSMLGEDTPEAVAAEILKRLEEIKPKNRLRKYRIDLGFSQSQLAQAAQVSLRAIQQYEQGAKDINRASAATLYQLSQVLGCRIEDLLQFPVR